MIITSLHYTFEPENADKVELLFRELIELSIKEPGVIRFDVGRSCDEPNVFALWEVYRDKEAIDAHYRSEHFNRLVVNGIRPLGRERKVVNAVPINKDRLDQGGEDV